MASSDGLSNCCSSSKANKKITITFTLPISCQICLGKVKQPVLCSNHHVFCSLCLEIWLNRNSQCPACRVDIGPDNPVRHIIGGQVEDLDCEKKSTPDFRRARFDLLYQEYEDQIDQMKKENIVLTTENNILIAQLKEFEDKNNSHKNKADMVPSLSTHSLQISDGPSLLMLTKKLQEAQRLYSTIKAHMSELKQENCKLKDENMHLTRENETLRLEIAQRSPKKFGRYTVATLETRIAEQEKEIRQLKKALECSDSYIEGLQRRQEKLHGKDEMKLKAQTSLENKAKFNINLEPKHFAGENCSSKEMVSQKEKHCKVLFGNVAHEDGSHASKRNYVSSTENSSMFPQKQHISKSGIKISDDSTKPDTESAFIQYGSNTKTTAQTFNHSDGQMITRRNPESVMEYGLIVSEPEFPVKDTDNGTFLQRNPKKVHFNISKTSDNGSSFDLEVPSPASSSSICDSHSSTNRELEPVSHKSSAQAGLSRKIDNQAKIDISNSNVEGNAHNLIPKKAVSFNSKLSTRDMSSHPQTSETSKKSKQIQGKVKRIKSSAVSTSSDQDSEDVNDSCDLSVPDIMMEEMDDNLSDTNNVTELDDDGLDISMTPELTYCLQLMHQAEKKINLPASKASSSQENHFSVGLAPGPSISQLPVYQTPHPSYLPHTSTDIHKSSTYPQYFQASTKSDEQRFAPSGSISSRWEQQFYNSVKVNPYKYTTSSKPQDFYMSVNNLHNNNENKASIDNKQELLSLPNFNPGTESATRQDFKFSDPLKVNLTSSNKPQNPFTHSDHANSLSHINLFNPSSIYQSAPSTSVISSSFPVTSTGYNFTPFTSKAYNSNLSSASTALSSPSGLSSPKTQIPNSTSSVSNSLLELPSSNSQSSKKNDHALSVSLSNSELEWPENS